MPAQPPFPQLARKQIFFTKIKKGLFKHKEKYLKTILQTLFSD
jgi:hypothetical protein